MNVDRMIDRISEFVEVTPELMQLCRESPETARVIKKIVFDLVKSQQELNLWNAWYKIKKDQVI